MARGWYREKRRHSIASKKGWKNRINLTGRISKPGTRSTKFKYERPPMGKQGPSDKQRPKTKNHYDKAQDLVEAISNRDGLSRGSFKLWVDDEGGYYTTPISTLTNDKLIKTFQGIDPDEDEVMDFDDALDLVM